MASSKTNQQIDPETEIARSALDAIKKLTAQKVTENVQTGKMDIGQVVSQIKMLQTKVMDPARQAIETGVADRAFVQKRNADVDTMLADYAAREQGGASTSQPQASFEDVASPQGGKSYLPDRSGEVKTPQVTSTGAKKNTMVIPLPNSKGQMQNFAVEYVTPSSSPWSQDAYSGARIDEGAGKIYINRGSSYSTGEGLQNDLNAIKTLQSLAGYSPEQAGQLRNDLAVQNNDFSNKARLEAMKQQGNERDAFLKAGLQQDTNDLDNAAKMAIEKYKADLSQHGDETKAQEAMFKDVVIEAGKGFKSAEDRKAYMSAKTSLDIIGKMTNGGKDFDANSLRKQLVALPTDEKRQLLEYYVATLNNAKLFGTAGKTLTKTEEEKVRKELLSVVSGTGTLESDMVFAEKLKQFENEAKFVLQATANQYQGMLDGADEIVEAYRARGKNITKQQALALFNQGASSSQGGE